MIQEDDFIGSDDDFIRIKLFLILNEMKQRMHSIPTLIV